MDEVGKRLKRDAGEIRAKVSPDLQRRIDASLRAARETPPVPRRAAPSGTSRWLSGLTGLTAAALVILWLNRDRLVDPGPADSGIESVVTVEEGVWPDGWGATDFRRQVELADVTRPLEEELVNLQADLERAKKNVERDVKFVF